MNNVEGITMSDVKTYYIATDCGSDYETDT